MYAVNVKADTRPTATDGDGVVMHTVKSDIRPLGGVEVSYPLSARVVFSANSEQTPLGNLYVNVACRILAIVTNYNAAGVGTGNATASGDLKFNSHRCVYLLGHIIRGIFLEVTQIFRTAGCSAKTYRRCGGGLCRKGCNRQCYGNEHSEKQGYDNNTRRDLCFFTHNFLLYLICNNIYNIILHLHYSTP